MTQIKLTLTEERDIILERASINYNFGNLIVDDMEGWEYSTPGREYTQKVYVLPENAEGTNEETATSLLYLKVIFKSNESAEIQEIYAIDTKGNIVGSF